MLQLPEFCVDRNLGKTVPARLSALGWTMHLIAEEFPDDAQAVSDQDWIDYGLNKGWVPLCKDSRIRGRDHEREPVERHAGVLFYLDNQQLLVDEMVRRIARAERDHQGGSPWRACPLRDRRGSDPSDLAVSARRRWPGSGAG